MLVEGQVDLRLAASTVLVTTLSPRRFDAPISTQQNIGLHSDWECVASRHEIIV